MPDYNFEAKARIPTRPLSYANKDLADNDEVVIDYEKSRIYIHHNGIFNDVTASVAAVVEEVNKEIEKNPEKITNTIKIEIPGSGGEKVTIDTAIIMALTSINELKDVLNYDSSKKTISVSPSSIKTDANNRFVTDAEKKAWNAKADMTRLTAVIKGGDSNWTATDSKEPYTQTITIADMKESYYPVVDVVLSDDYDTAMDELSNYAYIYKILTYDGSIKIYATHPTKINVSIVMKIDK